MTNATERQEAIERLREIQAEIEELLDEAVLCVRDAGGSARDAESHWKAHILCALRNDHEYLQRNDVTLQDTIEGLEAPNDDE